LVAMREDIGGRVLKDLSSMSGGFHGPKLT